VLHVITIHWKSSAWIAPQLRYLERFAPSATRVWASLNGIDDDYRKLFHYAEELEGTHPEKLNQLAQIAMADAASDDHLLFLDGDAFPVSPLAPVLADPSALVAARRRENFGDPQPHPCFCVTTVGFWRDIDGDWRGGYSWTNSLGATVTDPGGNLYGRLLADGIGWRPLDRVNTVDLHPLWFALYGDEEFGPVVYHHGAGFRERLARVDSMAAGFAPEMAATLRSPRWIPGARRVERRIRVGPARRERARWEREELPRQRQLAEDVFDAIVDDDDIVGRFVQRDPT
jgi:hypothetical protein